MREYTGSTLRITCSRVRAPNRTGSCCSSCPERAVSPPAQKRSLQRRPMLATALFLSNITTTSRLRSFAQRDRARRARKRFAVCASMATENSETPPSTTHHRNRSSTGSSSSCNISIPITPATAGGASSRTAGRIGNGSQYAGNHKGPAWPPSSPRNTWSPESFCFPAPGITLGEARNESWRPGWPCQQDTTRALVRRLSRAREHGPAPRPILRRAQHPSGSHSCLQ